MSKKAVVLLACGALARAESGLERFEAVEPHMGTLVRITLYAPDAAAAQSGFQAAFRRVKELDEILSDYNPQSELMRVCAARPGRPVRVSEDLYRVLEASQKLAGETDGAFDVTLGPVIRLWRDARREGKPPAQDEIDRAAHRSGYRKLFLNPAGRTVLLQSPAMQLDLGGIAKGYAADQAVAALRGQRISKALIAAGGDLVMGGAPPGAPGWRVRIESLGMSRVLVLSNAAVSTSGDAEQFLEAGGRRYSHIVDGKTGAGLTERIGVTIVADRGVTADRIATAVSVLGAERGAQFVRERGDLDALIVTEGEGGTRARTISAGGPASRTAPAGRRGESASTGWR